MSNSINKNAFFNTVKTIFGIIYPLITFPYISRVLTAENVGKISFGSSIVSYFSLLASLGISTYAIRECSKIRENIFELEKTVNQIISINIISTLVAYLALAITLIFAKSLENYRILICIQSSSILFVTLGADWINMAMEDFKFIAIRTVGMQLVSLVLMVIFVRKPEDYLFYALISVVASSGACIINIFYRRKFCKTKFTFHIDWKKHFPPILLLFSLIITQTIYCNSDITMLGLIKGDYEVGLYSTSVKIYTLVNQVIASIAFVIIPQLSENFAKQNFSKINELLKYAMSFIVTLGLPCIVGINVISVPILGTIGGIEYIGANISLHILTLALACSFIGGWIGNMMLIPSGKESVCVVSGIICAVVNVILNIFLIPKFGLNGAAFTTFIAELLGLIIGSRFIDKRIKIENFFELIKAPLIGSVFILSIGLIISKMIESYIMITVLTIFTSAIVYMIILYLLKNQLFLSFFVPLVNKIRKREK